MKKKRRELRKIFEMQCQICKAMGHPARLEIVDLLNGHEMSAAVLLDDSKRPRPSLGGMPSSSNCTVKKHLEHPPAIEVTASIADMVRA